MGQEQQAKLENKCLRWFVAALLITTGLRLWWAWHWPAFVDEAFYFQESLHPALAYTDVPGLTAWLIGASTKVLGESLFAVRLPFLLIGTFIPFLVVRLARRVASRADAWLAGALACLLPVGLVQGTMALPDAALTAAILLAWNGFLDVIRNNQRGSWTLFGLGLALGCLAHYRMAVPILVGALCVLMYRPLQRLWFNPNYWMALAIGVIGVIPALLFNLTNDWAAVRFQAVERHDWAFHATGLLQPLEQFLVAMPLVVTVVIALWVQRWRLHRLRMHARVAPTHTRDAEAPPTLCPQCVLILLASSLLIVYVILGLFADAIRTRLHWPHPAWLALLPFVPATIRQWRHRAAWRWLIGGLAFISAGLWLVFFAVGLWMGKAQQLQPKNVLLQRFYPANFVGWGEIATQWSTSPADENPTDQSSIRIADNFKTAAQLRLHSPNQKEWWVLDDALNAKHGRAAQLALWGLDHAALSRLNWQSGELIVEETATKPIDVLPRLHRMCRLFGSMRWLETIEFNQGRTRFSRFAVTPPSKPRADLSFESGAASNSCVLPILFDLHPPRVSKSLGGGTSIELRGWAIQDGGGIARLRARTLEAKGSVLGDWQELSYGTLFPGVKGQWPESSDPNHPRVGFEGVLKLNGSNSAVEIELAIESLDGVEHKSKKIL